MNNFNYVDASLIVTCFNEEVRIRDWVSSFLRMTKLPKEIVLVDSESTDNTLVIFNDVMSTSDYEGKINIIKTKCNISQGRNIAISNASFEVCLITDFGVKFNPDWCANLYNAMLGYDWAGGIYQLISDNIVQDSFRRLFDLRISEINVDNFLPSSRSFAMTKSIHSAVGGYDENLEIGEDTDLIYRLKKLNARYCLVKNAVVYWWPRENYKDLFKQNFRYAYWDGLARNNYGRLNHIAFLLFPLIVAVMLYFYFSNVYLFASVLPIFLIIIYLKVFYNVRNNLRSLPNITDLKVYIVTLFSGCLGFVLGLLQKRPR